MNNIVEKIKSWTYINKLPNEIAGFKLEKVLESKGSQFIIFKYCHEKQKKTFEFFYDSATKEFIAKKYIGLHEFCDIELICGD